ncbi:hypothetical protein NO1_2089 [Candidatus Termititenax aidoneus]|uniref:Uncharacterized protein n=1 Tax=Termititenax aidoneus TaxID=2218524 RepID=A0A388TDL3_TERA1|nr:hypothetical protein NO1_2089 [Candidatus Termititenax aidoneus]
MTITMPGNDLNVGRTVINGLISEAEKQEYKHSHTFLLERLLSNNAPKIKIQIANKLQNGKNLSPLESRVLLLALLNLDEFNDPYVRWFSQELLAANGINAGGFNQNRIKESIKTLLQQNLPEAREQIYAVANEIDAAKEENRKPNVEHETQIEMIGFLVNTGMSDETMRALTNNAEELRKYADRLGAVTVMLPTSSLPIAGGLDGLETVKSKVDMMQNIILATPELYKKAPLAYLKGLLYQNLTLLELSDDMKNDMQEDTLTVFFFNMLIDEYDNNITFSPEEIAAFTAARDYLQANPGYRTARGDGSTLLSAPLVDGKVPAEIDAAIKVLQRYDVGIRQALNVRSTEMFDNSPQNFLRIKYNLLRSHPPTITSTFLNI